MTYRVHTIAHLIECPAELRPLANIGDQVVIAIDPHRHARSVAHLLKADGRAFTLQISSEKFESTFWRLNRGAIVVAGSPLEEYAYRDGICAHYERGREGYQTVTITGLPTDDELADKAGIAGLEPERFDIALELADILGLHYDSDWCNYEDNGREFTVWDFSLVRPTDWRRETDSMFSMPERLR